MCILFMRHDRPHRTDPRTGCRPGLCGAPAGLPPGRKRAPAVFLTLLLLAFLLSGCSRNGTASVSDQIRQNQNAATMPDSGSSSGSDRDADRQTQAPDAAFDDADRQTQAAQAQTAFDDWSRRFLREQLGDSFLNLHYSLISPKDYGITEYTVDFGDFSLNSMQEARARQQEFQSQLAQIDPELLDGEQRLAHRILIEAFRLEESGDGLELYYQPLAPSNGIQAQLPILLAEFAFRSRQDIDDYLTLLSSIDAYYQSILDFEEEKAAAGLFMTDACVDRIVEECAAYQLKADHNFMTSTFDQRIDAFEGLSEEDRADYKARNLAVVEEHFIPAYDLLLNGLTQLKGKGVNDRGLCYYPDGKRYYEYLVASSTGTTYSDISELRDAVSSQIESDLMAMTDIIEAHPETVEQIDSYSFAYTDPDQILTQLQAQIADDFPAAEPCGYVTKYVPDELAHTLGPAFFLVPPIDDYDNCTIYINPDSTSASQALYTTLAHEGIPGHMYQNTYFLSHCDDSLRKIISFTSYSEGWAFYVENYSYTMENGLSPELGSLLAHNAAATLGLHAIIDINIHYFGWTREQVRDFLAPYFDVSEEGLVDTVYNAMLDAPVNYLEYYVGYLEILHMRDQAQAALGDRFSLKDFHQFLLDVGPAPFTVIREEFQVWLLAQSLR